MAVGGNGEHTRFPFLATVRYMVATVVTVLTVVVVVMVSTVAHRPEEIRLSINRGYIWADRLWLLNETEEEIPRDKYASKGYLPYEGRGSGDLQRPGSAYHQGPGCAYCQGRGSVGKVTQLVKTYRAADSVNLWVYLSAHNPSGRASVRCTITTIRVLDMPNARYAPFTFTGMVEIARFDFNNENNSVFSVPRQTSHSLRKSVVMNDDVDENALLYIFKQYVGKSSFIAMVEVNATVFYEPLLSTKMHNVSQLCWPVTVGYGTLPTAAVSCKTREEIDWTVNSQLPAPAPAPFPADGN